MFNFRYHIASLVAVFLALAIGLVLGTVVVERGVLDTQRTLLVKSLQSDFTDLRQENSQLKKDRDRDRAFAADIVPTLTTGALKGRSIVVITNSGRTDPLPVVQRILSDAGADVQVVTFTDTGFGLAKPDVATAMSSVITSTADTSMTTDPIVSALAAEWTRPGPQPVTQALTSAGVISVEGTGTIGRPAGVVLLAAFDDQADPALISLASALKHTGRPVVGAELQSSTSGVTDSAIAAGLSTVDAVDLPEGALSLVYVLAGKADGHFGVKPGASSAYPTLSAP